MIKFSVLSKLFFVSMIVVFSWGCGGGSSGSDDSDSQEEHNDDEEDEDDDEDDEESESDLNGSESSGFSKKVDVFGIKVLATSGVSDEKLMHAAKVLAEYIDNDNDGAADNELVMGELLDAKAFLFILSDESEEDNVELPNGEGQNLFAFEIYPEGSSSNGFDATLEETLHLVSHVGYAKAYPNIFGETDSSLTDAMDVARGGHFTSIPSSYPSDAWYTYDDETCDYACQATEYFYWSLTSILGAQDYSGRIDDIENEWSLNTAAKVQSNDNTIYSLMTDPQYNLPKILPNGNYTGSTLEITTP